MINTFVHLLGPIEKLAPQCYAARRLCVSLEHVRPSQGRSPGRHSIEVPIDTDVNWKGHRFLLTSRISQRSNALESTLRSSRAFYGTRDLSVAIKDDKVVVQPRGGGKGAASNVDLGTSTKWQMANVGTLDANSR